MKTARSTMTWLAAASALCVSPLPATAAQVVDIAWNDAGDFERKLSVAPGSFVELCGALERGQTVAWRVEASGALDFNIHFHEGKAVRTPARAEQARDARGKLSVESAQDYGWMWSNKAAAAASVQVQLEKR